jgi:alkanesulfonate monooxygenase SsuD/methylene tetrahydromethanopterin reductase-like flavin-dependent oxidoreductase (luciferase family)
MEFATLGEAFPGRFMAGLGHGSPGWVRQMGLTPRSPLGLLREATESTRQLLAGAELTAAGEYFQFDRVHLDPPPGGPVPIYLGVHGPASLRLSGELADGTLLGWFSSPGYVTWARERIDEGRDRSGRGDSHQLVVLCVLSISDVDSPGARRDIGRWVAPMLSSMAGSPQVTESAEGTSILELLEQHEEELLADGLPDGLLSEFVAAGDPESCAATIERLVEAGADRVVLVPNPAGYRTTSSMVEQIQTAAKLLS